MANIKHFVRNEIANYGSLPLTGDTNVLYELQDNGNLYRWDEVNDVYVPWWNNSTMSATTYWTSGSTGNYSIKAINDSTIDATGNYSYAEGVNTTASGDYSHAEGVNTIAIGMSSHAEGEESVASGSYSHAEGVGSIASGTSSHAGGWYSIASGDTSFVHSYNSLVTGNRSVILGGQNITGTTNDTVYVPYLNLNYTPSNNDTLPNLLVRDTDGTVKYRSVNSLTDMNVTGGTYDINTGVVTFTNNSGGTFNVTGFTSGMTDSYTTTAYTVGNVVRFDNNIQGSNFYSVDLTSILTSANTNFANTDLILSNYRTHDLNGYDLVIGEGSSQTFGMYNGSNTQITYGTTIWEIGNNYQDFSVSGKTSLSLLSTEAVFNNNGINYDFRVEGDTDQNLIFADASIDMVGIGVNSPMAKLHINNTTTGATFLAEDSANPDSTPFVIDSSGNVGIGVTGTTFKLDVNGTTIHRDHVLMDNTKEIYWSDTSTTWPTSLTNRIRWQLNNDRAEIYAFQPATDDIDFVFKISDNATDSRDNYVFWIDDNTGEENDRYPLEMTGVNVIVNPIRRYALSASTSASSVTNFYVLKSGATSTSSSILHANTSTSRVGINTSSPTETLHVNGNTRISGTLMVETLGTGTSINTLGIDASGNVVSATTTSGSNWDSGSTGNYSVKQITDTTTDATGNYAVVTGRDNLASGVGSFIGGGYLCSATTVYSTVIGGDQNLSSGFDSFVGGGDNNKATATDSSVIGGAFNSATATNSSVIGGGGNTATTVSSVIIGGVTNQINTGVQSVILGGAGNTLTGSRSIILGGQNITGATANDTTYATNFETRGGSVFNQDGGNFDFRVEGDTNTHLVFVDASTDRVGINNSAPDSKLSISTLEGDGISFDGMTDASLVGKHKFYTKQGETGTTGTNTSTIATIPLVSGDRITLRGIITGIGTGSLVVGGTFSAVGDNTAGTASIIGSVDTSVKSANSIGSPTFTVTASGGNILIRVTGGGENTQWVATYEYQIVSAPAG